jgi:hypothetical protein
MDENRRHTDEATATTNLAAFCEWLRATGRQPDADIPRLHAQLACPDAEFLALIRIFAKLAAPGGGFAAPGGSPPEPDAGRAACIAAMPEAGRSALALLRDDIRPDDPVRR